MLDVRRLKVLNEVVASGSFSAAADALHLSQSAVSQQIAVLEREAGVKLLERTSEGPKLTAAGERLSEHADAVICRLEEAERELHQIAGLEGGRLRVVSFQTASATLMTQAMSRFREQYPLVELKFAEADPEQSLPGVRRGDHDVALVFDFKAFPQDFGRDLEAEMIFEDPMYVALPPGHPLEAKKTVDLATLAEDDWLASEEGSACRMHIVNHCRAAGFEPTISFESDDYQVLQGLVAAGLGVGLLPELAQRDPSVEWRPIKPDPPIRRVWAVTRSVDSRSPAATEMLAILHEVGASHGAAGRLHAVA